MAKCNICGGRVEKKGQTSHVRESLCLADTLIRLADCGRELEQAEAEREVKEGESAGAYVERRIMDIFQEVAEHVGNEVFDLDHPAPIIRGSIVMTNAWNKYLASLRED